VDNKIARKDFFNQPINIDDLVVMADKWKSFSVNKVLKFTPKMVRVEKVDGVGTSKLVYPDTCMVVDPKLVTFYMLTKKKK